MFIKFDRKHIIFFICLFVSIFAFVYLSSVNSGAYEYAKTYLLNEQLVSEKYGEVKKVSLNVDGIKIREAGDSGSAKFTVSLTTDSGPVELKMQMSKTNGQWQVSSMEEI